LAQTQKRQVLDEVIGDWATGPNLTALSESLSKAVRALGGEEDDAPREIERKYLLNAMPPFVRDHAFSRLEQGYVPGSSIVERVRRKVDAKGNKKHFRTVKLGRGIERIEIEEEISAELFASLFALTKGRRVRKKRYAITEGAYTWEIDVFTDRELVLAEVELSSAEIQPTLPEWLEPFVVREVTDEDTYVNLNLAQ
jgi:CYTH domain-containing protein